MVVDDRVNPHWPQPIVQIIAGRAGAPWYAQNTTVPWAANVKKFGTETHFVLASVEKNFVTFEAYNELRKVIDRFSVHRKK